MKKDNTSNTLTYFINRLSIPVTRQSITDELQKHPEHSSLLAISDLLNNWNVPNAAYEFTIDELLSAKLPTPFIAYFGSKIAVIDHLDENHVVITRDSWRKHKLEIDEFKKGYSGFILIAEKEDNSGEADYKKKYRKQTADDLRLPFVLGVSAIILLSFLILKFNYTVFFNWQVALLTILKTSGLITTILLLTQSIDSNNPFIRKICGNDKDKKCNAILSSDAAKVSEELSWSEVGFFYFCGTWLALLFNSTHASTFLVLAIFNVISLPYTFYSIHHQWKVAKQWCLLCSIVQVLLWLEFFALLPSLLKPISYPSLTELGGLVIMMIIPIVAWVFIKPYLLLSKQIHPLKNQLRKFKYNIELFKKLLNDEVKYSVPEEQDSIILGNSEAENVITVVSSPYCQSCAKAHQVLDEWLEYRNDIKVQVIFSTQTNDKEDTKTQIATHFLSLQKNINNSSLRKAIKDWYEQKQKNYEIWAQKFPLSNTIAVDSTLDTQRQWCKLAGVTDTPTIFINGRKLPHSYEPEDIKYFI